ncbi:hypothetical protein [Rhizobium yanglingense]
MQRSDRAEAVVTGPEKTVEVRRHEANVPHVSSGQIKDQAVSG